MLRLILPVIGLLLLATGCSREPASFEEEVRMTYQNKRGFFYIKVPPALLTLVLKSAGDKNIPEFLGNARQVGIIAFGEGFPAAKNTELVTSLEEMINRYDYEDLITISDHESRISMKLKEEKGKVSELIILVSKPGESVMVLTLSGDIDIQTVAGLAADFDYGQLLEMQSRFRN